MEPSVFLSLFKAIGTGEIIATALNRKSPSLAGKVSGKGYGDDLDALEASLASRRTSLRFKARGLVAQYPVLISDNITHDTAELVSKIIEFDNANLLKLVMMSSDTQEETLQKGTSNFLSQYHNNITSGKLSSAAISESNRYNLRNPKELLVEGTLNKLSYTPHLRESLQTEYSPVLTEADDDTEDKKSSGTTVSLKQDEIKKMNNFSPTNVSVELSNGKDVKKVVIGVKAVLHSVKSQDIEYYLPNTVITKTPIMRLIQWTTGEISFFKDLVLAYDYNKESAKRSSEMNNGWWHKLESISKQAKTQPLLKRLLNRKGNLKTQSENMPIPTATMVITKENVDAIKYKHGYDLLQKPAMINKIIDNYFLMNFIVVDESSEILYYYNEETRSFSAYTFNSLQSQSKKKDIDIKDIYQLLK